MSMEDWLDGKQGQTEPCCIKVELVCMEMNTLPRKEISAFKWL